MCMYIHITVYICITSAYIHMNMIKTKKSMSFFNKMEILIINCTILFRKIQKRFFSTI